MGWQSEEFGPFHEGTVGVLIADGSEPKPVWFDSGSGGGGRAVSDWQVYSGEYRAPRADFLRGACSCGWRGASSYPVDWARVENWPDDIDTSGPHDDWWRHVEEVESRSVPLPPALEDLLERLEVQLSTLTEDAPLSALRAVASLERMTARTGLRATSNALADFDSEPPAEAWETIGTALGLAGKDARSRLYRYSRAS
jgi:hypothetical protein